MGKAKRKNSEHTPQNVNPFFAPLQALQNLITANADKGVIIGGIAVSLLGTPRYTVDIDAVFLLDLNDLPELMQAAAL